MSDRTWYLAANRTKGELANMVDDLEIHSSRLRAELAAAQRELVAMTEVAEERRERAKRAEKERDEARAELDRCRRVILERTGSLSTDGIDLWIARMLDSQRADFEHHSEHHVREANLERAIAAERGRSAKFEVALRGAIDAIDRDRSGMASALGRIVERVKGGWWITEGRGSYEWDDDRYRDETRVALTEILEIAKPALSASGALADVEYRNAKRALDAADVEPPAHDPDCTDDCRPGCGCDAAEGEPKR